MLTTYPQTRPLSLNHRDLCLEAVNQAKVISSTTYFSNLFLMDIENQTQISSYKENIIISFLHEPYAYCLKKPTTELIELLKSNGVTRIELLSDYTPSATIDADNSDYIYSIEKTLEHTGKLFEGFRRKLNQFQKSYNPLVKYNAESYDSLWQLANSWLDDKQKSEELILEMNALEKALLFREQLRLDILELQIEEETIGFTITEKTSMDTILIHFFKTNKDFIGCSESLFLHIAEKYQGESQWINFEQDLGNKGLQQFKKSLVPNKQLLQFTLTLTSHES